MRARAETTKHIDRLVESGEANVSQKLPIEHMCRDRLPEVVDKVETCLCREASSLEHYQDVSTSCKRMMHPLFAQIARQFNNRDGIEQVMQHFEERTGLPMNEAQREYYRCAVTTSPVLSTCLLRWRGIDSKCCASSFLETEGGREKSRFTSKTSKTTSKLIVKPQSA